MHIRLKNSQWKKNPTEPIFFFVILYFILYECLTVFVKG